MVKCIDCDDVGRCTGIDVRGGEGNIPIESFKYTYDNCNNIISEEMMHSSGTDANSGTEDSDGGDDDPDSDPDSAETEHISSDGSDHLRRDYTYNELSELTKVLEYKLDGDEETYEELLDNLLCTFNLKQEEGGQSIRTVTSENVFGIDSKLILSLRADNNKYIYTEDLRGSTTSIIDNNGESACIYYYDVYGEPETLNMSGLYNEIMYTGAVYDESTGLLYLRARYYDAQSGRFISEDSVRGDLANPLSLNYMDIVTEIRFL